MQAEHIPVHLGAMPSAVEAVLDEHHEPGARVDPQRPLPGRDAPPRHHGDHADLHRRRARGLRRQPRPSRRRRGARARQHAGRLAHARGRGRGDPALAPRRRAAAGAGRRACATPASARRTCARSSRPTAPARGASRRCVERFGLDVVRAGMEQTLDYAERRTRARLAELDDGTREAHDVLEAADGDLELRLRATVDGRLAGARLHAAPPPSTTATSTARCRSPSRPATSRCACWPTRTCRPAPAPTGR